MVWGWGSGHSLNNSLTVASQVNNAAMPCSSRNSISALAAYQNSKPAGSEVPSNFDPDEDRHSAPWCLVPGGSWRPTRDSQLRLEMSSI